METEKEAQKSP